MNRCFRELGKILAGRMLYRWICFENGVPSGIPFFAGLRPAAHAQNVHAQNVHAQNVHAQNVHAQIVHAYSGHVHLGISFTE